MSGKLRVTSYEYKVIIEIRDVELVETSRCGFDYAQPPVSTKNTERLEQLFILVFPQGRKI